MAHRLYRTIPLVRDRFELSDLARNNPLCCAKCARAKGCLVVENHLVKGRSYSWREFACDLFEEKGD